MRRHDRRIQDRDEIADILRRADSCRLAFAVGEEPYIVALNFGFEYGDELVLWFHCAREGRKLELMRRNNLVCFQADVDHGLQTADAPCGWGMKYRSVVGLGRLEEVLDEDERRRGLGLIMEHYGHRGEKDWDGPVLAATTVLRLRSTGVEGKKKV